LSYRVSYQSIASAKPKAFRKQTSQRLAQNRISTLFYRLSGQ
jgi:hypothetical protein